MPVCSASSDTTDAVVRMQGFRSHSSKCWRKWLLALVAMVVLSQVLVAQPDPPSRPVLFVHGYCGNALDWEPLLASLLDTLPSNMYPNKTVYLVEYNSITDKYTFFYEAFPDLQVDPQIIDTDARFFAIQFYDPIGNDTDPDNVIRISALNKAYELKKVIEKIKDITNPTNDPTKATGVNIVAHSMGGLDARAYVENMASVGACYDYAVSDFIKGAPDYLQSSCSPGATGAAYANDVANIVTLDTPHRGTPLATPSGLGELASSLNTGLQCEAFESTNMNELLPGLQGAGFLEALNYSGATIHQALPSINSVPIHAIEDYFIDLPIGPLGLSWLGLPGESDEIVQKDSQAITTDLETTTPTLQSSQDSTAHLENVPLEYTSTRSDINNNSDCWGIVPPTPDFQDYMLHSLKCLGALPEVEAQITGQLVNGNLLWINSWNITPSTISLGDPVTIGYSAVESGSSTISAIRLWRAPDDQPGAWALIPTDPISGGSKIAQGTFQDKPLVAGTYWYIADVRDGVSREARAPVAVPVIVSPAGAIPSITGFTATPSTVNGGDTVTYSVTLSGPAPTGGASIAFSSSAANVIANATLQIPAGITSGQTSVIGQNPVSASQVTITASYDDSSVPAVVTVNPVATTFTIGSFTATPSTVGGGNTITYSITLTGPAPTGGAPITFTSSAPGVIPYSSLQIPAGTTSGQATVVAQNPASASQVTITASFNNSSSQATITVNPAVATTYTLTVNSANPSSGVVITDTPPDNNGKGSFATSFNLTYNQNTQVTLSAPSTAEGNTFSSWTGCDQALSTACTVTMTASRTVTANYTTATTQTAHFSYAQVTLASIYNPTGVAVDGSGGNVLVGNYNNYAGFSQGAVVEIPAGWHDRQLRQHLGRRLHAPEVWQWTGAATSTSPIKATTR